MTEKEQDENRAFENAGLAGAQAETVQRYVSLLKSILFPTLVWVLLISNQSAFSIFSLILCLGVLKTDTPDSKIPCISASAEVQYPKPEHEKEPF